MKAYAALWLAYAIAMATAIAFIFAGRDDTKPYELSPGQQIESQPTGGDFVAPRPGYFRKAAP